MSWLIDSLGLYFVFGVPLGEQVFSVCCSHLGISSRWSKRL